MRRNLVHAAFGAVALCSAAVAAYDWTQLNHARDVAQAVAAIGAKSGSGESGIDAPEVRLASAITLAKRGAYADAQKLFDGLVQEQGAGEIGRAALFDLGNMYAREAASSENAGLVKSLPLLEQAKQRYRTLLRATPLDWDARYNLERVLWLAPEESGSADEPDVKEQHDVKLRGSQAQDLP
jgi:mxaK protein